MSVVVLVGGLHSAFASYREVLCRSALERPTFFIPAHAKFSVHITATAPEFTDAVWGRQALSFEQAGQRLHATLAALERTYGELVLLGHSLGATVISFMLCELPPLAKLAEVHLVTPAWALHAPAAGSVWEWLLIQTYAYRAPCFESFLGLPAESMMLGAGRWLLASRATIGRVLGTLHSRGVRVVVYWGAHDPVVSRNCGVACSVPEVTLEGGHNPFGPAQTECCLWLEGGRVLFRSV